jgi:hypothetical protein
LIRDQSPQKSKFREKENTPMIRNLASNLRGLVFAGVTLACLIGSSFAAAQFIRDVDAPARKPLQTIMINIPVPAANVGLAGSTFKVITTVPAGQRLVVEHVSGSCAYIAGFVGLESTNAGTVTGFEYLPGDIFTKLLSIPVKFYANPGDQVGFLVSNQNYQGGYCGVTLTGYLVNLRLPAPVPVKGKEPE